MRTGKTEKAEEEEGEKKEERERRRKQLFDAFWLGILLFKVKAILQFFYSENCSRVSNLERREPLRRGNVSLSNLFSSFWADQCRKMSCFWTKCCFYEIRSELEVVRRKDPIQKLKRRRISCWWKKVQEIRKVIKPKTISESSYEQGKKGKKYILRGTFQFEMKLFLPFFSKGRNTASNIIRKHPYNNSEYGVIGFYPRKRRWYFTFS